VSGIVGILNLDGAPVDRRALARMVEFLAFRGPDGEHIWIDGPVGLGHTLLKTTNESDREQQPFMLDSKFYAVADARIDARLDLVAELKAKGHNVPLDSPDVALIARSYAVWQDDCVEHLLGDFAFAIWDAPRRRLFCARDHMGVKSFFYASVGACVVFSNTLDSIRQHPAVSDRLNELACADFLMFGLNNDNATTTFAEIDRIPPAHSAVFSQQGSQLRRYWTLPVDEPIYYRRRDDYVDCFRELLQAAVDDRLRTRRVGVLMSGGLDSTTLACLASTRLRENSCQGSLRAFTTVRDAHDGEFLYASLVAAELGMPIEFRHWNPESVDSEWYEGGFHTPEPIPYPTSLAADWAYFQLMASHSRVQFYGEGPDNALRCEWRSHLSFLARRRHFGRILYDLYFETIRNRRLPIPAIPWISKIRARWEKREPCFFDWFNPALERRLELRSRWKQLQVRQSSPHPTRPEAYRSMNSPLWQSLFEGFEPPYTASLLEVRHPYVDLRVMRFMLAVPVLPWCRSKYLLRRAMRGLLPDPVLARPKSPVLDGPWVEHVLQFPLPHVSMTPPLEHFVDKYRPEPVPVAGSQQFWNHFRVRSLSYWLRNMQDPKTVPQKVEGTGLHCV
jgi:asparagine synthase (glutamine-hydrolysing)